MNICIFGASGRELEESYYAAAELLGSLIAQDTPSCSAAAGRVSWEPPRGARINTAAIS